MHGCVSLFVVGSQMGKSLIGGAGMFFKKAIVYCLSILVLLVPLFVSVQTAVPAVFADDDVAGPEVQGYGVKPSAFEYAGYKLVPWDLGDKVQPFDIPEYMQRANDNNDNAFSRVVRSCSAAGFPYIIVIDTYKCVGSSSIYDKSGMTYIYAFKSIPTFTMVEVGVGTFIYKSSPITDTYRKYHVKGNALCSSDGYGAYGYFANGYSSTGSYDIEVTVEKPHFFYIAENFSGMKDSDSSVSGVDHYKNSGRAINFFSNFDPQIEGIDFDGGQAVKDSIFDGQHTGSVVATTSLSGSIDTATTTDFTVSIKNSRSDSIQYVLYITSSATINSSDISTTYQAYKWCYQTYQSCRVYRGSIAQTVVDKTVDFLDVFGERVPLSSATTIPLYMLLKKIGDSQVLGVYTSSYLSCPYHFLSSGNLDDLSFSISELPLSDGQTYYLTVVCRDTTVQEVSVHHRATYSYCYYDDISQFSSYDVVLSESFSLTKNVYVAPSLNDKGQQVDKDGNVIKDSFGNPISSSKNYSQDIISLKQGNTASDAFATGGSASAQGGSAEVVNNNNPTFNNNPSVVVNAGGSGSGGSGGGTAQDFDDVDTTTFQNLWDSCGNFFSFVKKIWATFPLQASLVSGIFVVLFVLRVARR